MATPVPAPVPSPTKSFLMSKTFWGLAIAMVSGLFPHLLANLGITDTNLVVDHAVTITSTAFAFYGRWAAGGLHLLK